MTRRPPDFGAETATGQSRFALLDVSSQKEFLGMIAQQMAWDSLDPKIVRAAKRITMDCAARDDECELQAIFNAVKYGDPRVEGLEKGVRYQADNFFVDFSTSPKALLEECEAGACSEDCLPPETLVLGAGYKLQPIGDLKVGDTIMGDGKWVRVTNFWDKGVQDIIELKLSNGSVLRCTPGHKLFRVQKRRVKGSDYAGDDRNAVEEVRAGDVQLDDDLLTLDRLPEGTESLDPDKAWLLGVHIADGWCDDMGAGKGIRRASISGKDGHPKEEQKRRVQRICDANGWASNWQARWITIKDVPTALWLAACGHTAINKHVPSLNFDLPTIKAILEGLSADASSDTGVFGTISPTLALQHRIMHRMLGIGMSVRRQDEHQGLGKNPIYRARPLTGKKLPWARVQSISSGGESPTVDIEVEGHRFYLPETDLVVHNCESQAALCAALAAAVGFRVGLRAWGPPGSKDFTHLFAVALVPKEADTGIAEYGLDPSADVGGGGGPGWQPDPGNALTAWITADDYDKPNPAHRRSP